MTSPTTYPFCAVSAKKDIYEWTQSDCNTSRGVACKVAATNSKHFEFITKYSNSM